MPDIPDMPLDDLVEKAKKLFSSAFGGPATIVVCAPGRVNLIGEHTDYNEGFVMPFCIQRCTVLAARRVEGGARCRVVSANQPGGAGAVVEFPGDATIAPVGDWTNYMAGVVAQYLDDLPGGRCGFEAAVVSTVPLGGGLSSSASLEVATATMLEAMCAPRARATRRAQFCGAQFCPLTHAQFPRRYGLAISPKEKALRCQKCEHQYCSTPCGIMDQFISACGVAGHVLLIDCRPPFATQLVPLADPDVTLVVANSNVKHTLSGSEYPDRVRQCKEACAAMRAAGHPTVQFLRDATAAMLDATHAQTTLPLDVLKRARHGITEDARTLEAVGALKARDYTKVGGLMLRSHASLRDEYEVSCPELDALVEIAMGVSGVFGSRMTGGGFGGCTISLVRKSAVPALLKAIKEEYPRRTGGKKATCFVTEAAHGAHVLENADAAAARAVKIVVVAAAAVAALAVLMSRRK